MNIKSVTLFDVLFIVKQNADYAEEIDAWGVQVYAYLACLLSVYGGDAPDQWGYLFAATEKNTPFSPDIAEALTELLNRGLIAESQDKALAIAPLGEQYLAPLCSFGQYQHRIRFLKASIATALALPIGVIRLGLSQEPSILETHLSVTTKILNRTDSARGQLLGQFKEISQKIGADVEELMIPAVTWISLLASKIAVES